MSVLLIDAQVCWLGGVVRVVVSEQGVESEISVEELYGRLSERERLLFEVAAAYGRLNK